MVKVVKVPSCLLVCLLILNWSFPASALEIIAAGDVTLAWNMYKWQPASLFSEAARKRINAASLFLWNCETSGVSAVTKKENSFVFCADGSFFDQMRFENGAACTANNHVYDGYSEGARELLRILRENGLRHNGIHTRGQYVPLRVDKPFEPSIYFLTGSPMSQRGSSPTYTTLNYPELLVTIDNLRQQDTHAIIVVYAHDGTENTTEPSLRQKFWALQFARAGADVVLYAHNHLYCPFEVLENTPRNTFVAWGLGNFLFGGNFQWKTKRDVRLLSIQIDPVTGNKKGSWILGQTHEWEFSLIGKQAEGTISQQ